MQVCVGMQVCPIEVIRLHNNGEAQSFWPNIINMHCGLECKNLAMIFRVRGGGGTDPLDPTLDPALNLAVADWCLKSHWRIVAY